MLKKNCKKEIEKKRYRSAKSFLSWELVTSCQQVAHQ